MRETSDKLRFCKLNMKYNHLGNVKFTSANVSLTIIVTTSKTINVVIPPIHGADEDPQVLRFTWQNDQDLRDFQKVNNANIVEGASAPGAPRRAMTKFVELADGKTSSTIAW